MHAPTFLSERQTPQCKAECTLVPIACSQKSQTIELNEIWHPLHIPHPHPRPHTHTLHFKRALSEGRSYLKHLNANIMAALLHPLRYFPPILFN